MLMFNTCPSIKKLLPYKILCLLLFTVCCKIQAQDRIISGRITDAQTKLPLFSCSIYSLNSGNGVITDENGKFTFPVNDRTDSIAMSMIGYKTISKPISKALRQEINFEAERDTGSMAAITVAIKTKYTKAQRLILKVIKNKDQNDAFYNKTFQCRIYDKIEFDLKNIPEKLQNNRLLKPLAFAFNNLDTTKDNQQALPVYISESNSDYYYRKSPEKERYDYTAIKSSGLANKSIAAYIDGLYKKINIYNNNIKLVDVNFVSPIADNALSYYDYHILDTVFFGSNRCIQVQFSPLHFGSNTFNGYIWIADTSYAVKSLVMHMDKNANINFVKKFEISQFYKVDSQNKFLPEKNILYIDLTVPAMKKIGVIAKKTTLYKNIILNNDRIDTAFDKKTGRMQAYNDDLAKAPIQRFETLSKSEKSIYVLMDTLNKIPVVVAYSKIISAMSTGYYTSGRFDIGDLYYLYTNNLVEGNRFTFGLKTNYTFNGHIQLRGYAGYATKDKQFRYLLSSFFVLNPQKWSTLKLELSSDITGSYDHSDELDQNSIFAAFLRRVKYTQSRLINSQYMGATWLKYLNSDFAIGAKITHNVFTPFFNVYYTYNDFKPYMVNANGGNNSYNANEVTFSLRYSHKEKFITQHYRRGSLGSTYPIVTLSYTKGIKVNNGFLKSDFNFSRWNLYLEHDFTDGRIGQLSYIIDAGLTNGVLPIVLLDVIKGNDTYYYNKYAFNNMNRFEFVTDKYASLAVQQSFGGFPFKYFPLLKRFKWRSLITFRGVIGDMSQANKIANGYYDTAINYHFTVPNKVPYMETGVGIDNIFHLLRIDAVWRLNYLNNPGIPKFGIKGSMELKF